MPHFFWCPVTEWATLAGELLRRDLIVRLRVRGWSMHPAIRDGEVVWIAPAMAQRLHLGQVLLYTGAGGRPLLHRLVRQCRQDGEIRLRLASDAPFGMAEWVSARQVLGRAVAVERAGRCICLDGPMGRLQGLAWMLLRPLRPFLAWLRRWKARTGLSPSGPDDGRPAHPEEQEVPSRPYAEDAGSVSLST